MSTQIYQSLRRMVAMAWCSRIRLYVPFEVVPFVLPFVVPTDKEMSKFFLCCNNIRLVQPLVGIEFVIKSLCSTLQLSRPVIMSGDECTERSADHDDAQTSFSKLVENLDAKWEKRFETEWRAETSTFPRKSGLRSQIKTSKSGGYFNSVRGSNRSRYCS